MTFDPRIETLGSYDAGEFKVACLRCRRGVAVERYRMLHRFGDISLMECARRIATAGGCALASISGAECSVTVEELEVWTWGKLSDARRGGWRPMLTCRRRYAAMKATESCPGVYHLDMDTLIAALGEDYVLSRLHSKAKCPRCQTESVEIEWHRPDPPKDPAPIKEKPPEPVRLRPTRAEAARRKLGVVKG